MENEEGGEEPFRRLELGFRLRSAEKELCDQLGFKVPNKFGLGSKHREIGNFPNSRLINLRAFLVVSWLDITLIGRSYPSCDELLLLWTVIPLNCNVLEL
ncbi:hypothetical protein AVEN_87807-1 [Araneus ventricosus]|uniref:Uncharacterized protein n=1 Tax=Araneus ventricosus TaxID=182803 RepID=A0A4Y2BBN3_ARAVE|nr:hypothetical protein AVEN_87807-1 [Araneus ventricosus]